MRIILALTLAATLAACGTPPPPKPWIKAGGDQNDIRVCTFEAEKGAVSSDLNAMVAAFERAERRQKLMKLCMESKGWTR